MITLEELLLSLLLYISEGLAVFHMHMTSNTLVYTKRINNLEKTLSAQANCKARSCHFNA